MFIVSYYVLGTVKNVERSSWTDAIRLASLKALRPKACPVMIMDQDGHLLWQVNK